MQFYSKLAITGKHIQEISYFAYTSASFNVKGYWGCVSQSQSNPDYAYILGPWITRKAL